MYLYMGPAQSRSLKHICWMGEWDNFKTYIWSWAASAIFRKKSRLLFESSQPIFNLELVDFLAFSLCCHNQQFMLCLMHSQPTPLLVLSLLSNTFLLIHQMWKFPLTLLQENDPFSISRSSHILAGEPSCHFAWWTRLLIWDVHSRQRLYLTYLCVWGSNVVLLTIARTQ